MLDVPETKLTDYLADASAFLNGAAASSANATALIHCNAGVSRSVSIAVAYLLSRTPTTLDDILALIKRQRPAARPNDGFMAQVCTFA
jgi:protein-tyrosine phosphatase